MPFLELFDETLDINSTENYELSVQVSNDNLSFCILDTLRNKFVLLRSYETEENSRFDADKIADVINKDDFLIRHYKKVTIVIPSHKSTLVPGPLYEDYKAAEYFTFNQVLSDSDKIMTSKIPDPDICIIYSLPNGFMDVINNSFPGRTIIHQFLPVFRYIKYNRRSLGGNSIHINIERDYINMIIFDQNALRFCNTFQFRTVSDIQYYIIYVLKKLNISHDETVYFSGMAIKQEEIMRAFSAYLTNVRFALPSGDFTFSYVLGERELNRFLILFSAAGCE